MRVNTMAAAVSFLFFLPAQFVQAAVPIVINVTSLDGDFVEKRYGLAKLEAVFELNGKPVGGAPVSWKVLSVENRSKALPVSGKNRVDGLRWEHPYPSRKRIDPLPAKTDSIGTAKASLADIIGERTVTVAVTAEHDGKEYRAEQSIVFGNGPLSLFATPLAEPVTWFELYERCNGEPYPGNPAEWEVGAGFVGGSKIPSLEQMQSISMQSENNPSPSAFAAAAVAGWPVDKRYWNGRAVMKNRASHMDVLNGTHHGSGGNDVKVKEYGVCLR